MLTTATASRAKGGGSAVPRSACGTTSTAPTPVIPDFLTAPFAEAVHRPNGIDTLGEGATRDVKQRG